MADRSLRDFENTDAGDAEFADNLLTFVRGALERGNIDECRRVTGWAEANPHAGAIPALCALLLRPSSYLGRKAWHRETAKEMRIAAIRALRNETDPVIARTLAQVLLHDCPTVRPHAAEALKAMCPQSVIPLIESVRSAPDWPLEGMVDAIETLGALEVKSAGPTVARILFGLLPVSPSRWRRCQIAWSAGLAALPTAWVATYMLRSAGWDTPLLVVFVSLVLYYLGFAALCGIGTMFITHQSKTNEANVLNYAASDALVCLKDPRSVPSLVEVATEKYSYTARVGATRALQHILPVLRADDYGLLTGAVERRMTGMFAMGFVPIVLEVVRCLEFVGSGQSVGPIERLVKRKPAAYESESTARLREQIQAEAERVLPVLVERRRMEEASSVLLRPSQSAADSTELLLRPTSALAAYEEAPEQLLRPSTRE